MKRFSPWRGHPARRLFPLVLTALVSLPAQAILDTNSNDLSDLWEKEFNNKKLFPPTFDPQADPDGDGWTNAQEAAAGTNPFQANAPDGIIRPDVVHIPATYFTSPEGTVLLTPEAFTITWPTLTGKKYTLYASPDLTPGSWLPIGPPFIAAGGTTSTPVSITQSDGSTPEKLFWRVATEDADTDTDGLTNAEENTLGTNPGASDSDGDGLGDLIDPEPLNGLPAFPDADHDGIADADDLEPNNSRGAPPSLASPAANTTSIVNVTAGDDLVFLLTVENPAGPSITSSNLKLFIGGSETTAVFTPVAANQFSLSWNAQIHPEYPGKMLRNLAVRFQDAHNATAWLELARCDVAEWQGMLGGLVRRGPVMNTETYSITSHADGVKLPKEPWAGKFGNSVIWYRGPKTISLFDTNNGNGKGQIQITGNMRYPFFIIHDPTGGGAMESVVRDISDPAQYPQGFWYLNNWSTYFRMTGSTEAGSWDVTAQPGQDVFQAFPTAAGDMTLTAVSKYWNADINEEQTLENNLWPIPASGSGRRMYFWNLYAGADGAPRGSGDGNGSFHAPMEVHIVPCGAGSLEFPGLPVDPWPAADPLLMTPGQWHKITIKVGPDAAAVSRGIRLSLNPGHDGEGTAQTGFESQRKTDQGFAPFIFPTDGHMEILNNSEIHQQITGTSGLVLFAKCTTAVDQYHQLAIHLLPRGTTLDPVQIKTMGLVPVDIDDNTFATGVDDVSMTADPADIGYQDKFWIMAPCGGQAYNNDMRFKIPLSPAADLKIASANATPSPDTTALGNAPPSPIVTWRGNGAESIDDSPAWKIGPTQEPVTLPIRVKTMKKRTVKVAVHPVSSVVAGRPNDPPDLLPTKDQVEEELNKVFGYQVNAYFVATILPQEDIPFDIADAATTFPGLTFAPGTPLPVPGDRILNFTAWEIGEVGLLTANRPADYDVHVFVFGGATPIVTYQRSELNPFELVASEQLLGRATDPGPNYCIVDGDRDTRTYDLDGNPTGYIYTAEQRSIPSVVHTIAHEIGHIVLPNGGEGGGHPDDEEGVAPLKGTDRTKRLMCSGPRWSITESKLLVKKEWDSAETWLKKEIDEEQP